MAHASLYLTCLLCMLIRPVCSAPTLIVTTPSNEDSSTTVRATEGAVITGMDTNNSQTALANSRANNINDNDNFNQSDTTELGSQNSPEGASTIIGHFQLTTPTSGLQSRAEISTATNTSPSGLDEFNVTNNASDADVENVTINEQSRHLDEPELSNDTISFNATGRSDTSDEGNSSIAGNRVIFVLPGPVNFSSHAIVNGEDTNQTASDASEPPGTEFNEPITVLDNLTESFTETSQKNVDIEGREESSESSTSSIENNATQEPTNVRTFNTSQNSSLEEHIELALSQGSNNSNSEFANYLADLISFYSGANGTVSPEPEATPSGDSINANQSADSAITDEPITNSSEILETESSPSSTELPNDNATSSSTSELHDQGNATVIDGLPEHNSDSNNSTELNEIFSSSLESKSAGGSPVSEIQGNETSTEPTSNFNDSLATNEISDASSHSWKDSATVASPTDRSDVESVTESLTDINTDAAATQAINLEPSSEQADTVATTSLEVEVTTEMTDNETTPNSTLDENLMQRNDLITEKTLINENEEVISEITSTLSEDDKKDTTETVESTTVSGDDLFANTPLEYFINSSTITTLDLTTVASIVGSQGTPPNSFLEIYNRHTPKTSCSHQGREYATGQHVEQLDPCHFCVCVNGYLDCYWKNCPPAPEGCMELDFDGVCDRSLYLCPIPKRGEPLPFPANSISRFRRDANYTQMTCDILGVEYRVGELIGVASDPCMECRCALDSLYCSPKCCFQPVESGQDPSKNSRANDNVWQPVLSHPLKHLRYDFENQYRV